MVEMNNVITKDANIEIDGIPFYAKEIKGTESFVRRDLKRVKIMNGTEFAYRNEYIPREYSFSTSIDVPDDRPDEFNDIFVELCNKPCEIICPDMGGKFDAEVTIKTTHPTGNPTMLDLDITIKEIPDSSLIPNDTVEKPSTEILMTDEDLKNKYGETK